MWDTSRARLTSIFWLSSLSTTLASSFSTSQTESTLVLTVRLSLTVSKCQSLKRVTMSQLQLSARAYHRILKLARTIADLAGSENIQSTRLAEVLHLWSLEDHDVMNTFFEHDIRFINKQTLNQFYFLLT